MAVFFVFLYAVHFSIFALPAGRGCGRCRIQTDSKIILLFMVNGDDDDKVVACETLTEQRLKSCNGIIVKFCVCENIYIYV